MTTYKDKKDLILISGASRGIGKAYADCYRIRDNYKVIGLGRSINQNITLVDLLDEYKVNLFVNELDLKNFRNITYMHAIGIDKFEPDGKPHIDRDCDGIDDDVYSSNVTAFLNLAQPLIEKTRDYGNPLTIVNIGSISDIYEVPYWQSFSKAKNIVRKYLKSVVYDNVKSVTINVSSTLDENNCKYGRVNADISYWQTSKELVSKSIDTVERMRDIDSNYMEIDFCKRNPNFKSDYFTNLPKLFASWQRDMGLTGKDVPHGIRI